MYIERARNLKPNHTSVGYGLVIEVVETNQGNLIIWFISKYRGLHKWVGSPNKIFMMPENGTHIPKDIVR